MQKSQPNYWAFSASPNYYRIEAAIRDLKEDLWTVPHRDVQAGDQAIIWKAKGKEDRRGIVALARVLTNPTPMKDLNNQYWVDQNAPNEVIDRVRVRYLVPPKLPLWEGETNLKVLEERELSVARATGGTVFHVTSDQWEAIMEAIGGWPAPEIEDAELAIAELVGKNQSEQGFQIDVAVRRAIEQHAMLTAKTYYEEQGWSVSDVSSTCSYDLSCVRNTGEILHVEVKGTTSEGKQILLTSNEVNHARFHYPRVVLFVLAHIQVDHAFNEKPQVSGGEIILLEPWNVDEGTRSPIAFAYLLPKRDIHP